MTLERQREVAANRYRCLHPIYERSVVTAPLTKEQVQLIRDMLAEQGIRDWACDALLMLPLE
jgi:hypothetical protein